MYFLKGSHKFILGQYKEKGYFSEVKIGKNMNDIFLTYPQLSNLESVAAEMKAGSCSFHSGMLVHGAGPNMTPWKRRAMTYAMMPNGSKFNGKQNILTTSQMSRLKIGDELNQDSDNPILYQRK
eukprot:TRINITY_DN15667_c0_g1_i1.p1 TRINITY_DN15667_c0_g1~~TRINITY_DN15667_c0_g1_i1.p1  ORF type:complete len:124 (-),score=23.60 TRINITY_DN15667_c0_g1_i1:49-420(-)